MPTYPIVNNFFYEFPCALFGYVIFYLQMKDNTKQIEAANRIGKMFLGCANGHAAFGYLTGYISGELKWSDTGSLDAEKLEKILSAALNYANTSNKS